MKRRYLDLKLSHFESLDSYKLQKLEIKIRMVA
jgi:hypothetical protein